MTVYLIRHPGDQAVKIGFTDGDPLDRIRSMQTGSASVLELVAVIPDAPMRVEKELHAQFAALRRRSNGEWFDDHPSIHAAFIDHQAASHRAHLEDRMNQVINGLTDTLANRHPVGTLEETMREARAVLDHRGCGCGFATSLDAAVGGPVTEFWREFEDRFVWDLLPFPFLYDLFKAWFTNTNPSGFVVSSQQFTDQLLPHVETSTVWQCEGKRKDVRVSSRMSTPELLIAEYDLSGWMNQNYTGKDMFKRSIPTDLRPKYRGLVRIPGATAAIPTVAVDDDLAAAA